MAHLSALEARVRVVCHPMKDPSEKAPDVAGKSGFDKMRELMHEVARSPGVVYYLILPDQNKTSWLALAQQAGLRAVKSVQLKDRHACLSDC